MDNYLARLFISKNAVNDGFDLPALRISQFCFVQGYISVCGDALYSTEFTNSRSMSEFWP